jgi:hypothetical protein
MCFSHFTEATPCPVGHDEPEGRAVVGVERLAVHLVGDQDLGFRMGCVGEGQGPHEGQVGPVGVRKHWLEQVGLWSAPVKWTSTPSAAGLACSNTWCRRAPVHRAVETA